MPPRTAQRRSEGHSWNRPMAMPQMALNLSPAQEPWRAQLLSCLGRKHWPFQKLEPAPTRPFPPARCLPIGRLAAQPEKVHNLNMSALVSLIFSRTEKRKGRKEYKEAIKETLNKLHWEPVCVEGKI